MSKENWEFFRILWQIISNVSEELFIPGPLNLVLLVLDFRTFSVTYHLPFIKSGGPNGGIQI